jgi:intracellular sulfur oxidation DsrE/DsrF family protein
MKQLLFFCCLLFSFHFSQAQKVPYNVVFDLTSKDTNMHTTVIRWLDGISKDDPTAKLEVVLYGQSLDLVQKNKSAAAADMQRLMQNPNIQFAVCAVAMKKHNVNTADLLPGVRVVPDGIYEIITKQKEGWGYIKAVQ